MSVSYLLWRDIFKKCCHAKAFKIQNDPTRSASLINLFGLGRVVHMDQGVILEQGSPKEVFGNPKEPRTREFLSRYLEDKMA